MIAQQGGPLNQRHWDLDQDLSFCYLPSSNVSPGMCMECYATCRGLWRQNLPRCHYQRPYQIQVLQLVLLLH